MKRKIFIISIVSALVLCAFFAGKPQSKTETTPDKYRYLDCDSVTETQIKDGTVFIYTSTGDYYAFDVTAE